VLLTLIRKKANMTALIKCMSCGADVSRAAAACPKCGHPITGQHTGWGLKKWILAIFASLIIFPLALKFGQGMNEAADPGASVALGSSTPEPDRERWTYEVKDDPMKAGRKDYYAETVSQNTLAFAPPYEGSQHARLMIRNSAQYGKDVIFSIARGQFICGVGRCFVQVAFDANQPESFEVHRPTDLDSTVVFIADYKKFVKRLATAQRVKIQATFYQEGDHVLEFDVSGLDASRLQW
jgi:hypothetical protein